MDPIVELLDTRVSILVGSTPGYDGHSSALWRRPKGVTRVRCWDRSVRLLSYPQVVADTPVEHPGTSAGQHDADRNQLAQARARKYWSRVGLELHRRTDAGLKSRLHVIKVCVPTLRTVGLRVGLIVRPASVHPRSRTLPRSDHCSLQAHLVADLQVCLLWIFLERRQLATHYGKVYPGCRNCAGPA